jgi:hypothetical protein
MYAYLLWNVRKLWGYALGRRDVLHEAEHPLGLVVSGVSNVNTCKQSDGIPAEIPLGAPHPVEMKPFRFIDTG